MSANKTQEIVTHSSFPKSSWHRVDYQELTVFFHTEQLPKKDNPSHRHCDLTSFVLYWKGLPVLVDPGRLNYRTEDPLGNYGVSANCHNCLMIDGFEQQASVNTRRLPDFYRSSEVRTRINKDNEKLIFEIEHNGFLRLVGDSILHTRTFIISQKRIIIEDLLQGGKSHQLDTYFHWSPKIKVVKNVEEPSYFITSLTSKQFEGLFRYEQVENSDSYLQSHLDNSQINANGTGWYFPQYGIKEKTTTLVFSDKVKLPIVKRYSLEWKA